jgi:hypothetical protein
VPPSFMAVRYRDTITYSSASRPASRSFADHRRDRGRGAGNMLNNRSTGSRISVAGKRVNDARRAFCPYFGELSTSPEADPTGKTFTHLRDHGDRRGLGYSAIHLMKILFSANAAVHRSPFPPIGVENVGTTFVRCSRRLFSGFLLQERAHSSHSIYLS